MCVCTDAYKHTHMDPLTHMHACMCARTHARTRTHTHNSDELVLPQMRSHETTSIPAEQHGRQKEWRKCWVVLKTHAGLHPSTNMPSQKRHKFTQHDNRSSQDHSMTYNANWHTWSTMWPEEVTGASDVCLAISQRIDHKLSLDHKLY